MLITAEELKQGSLAYQEHEPRDAMYKVATFLTAHFWGQPAEVANGLGVLLLTWNRAFYQYGLFDFDALQAAIDINQELLNKYRAKTILTHALENEADVSKLYDEFLVALQRNEGRGVGKRSPVSVSKALHLLCPGYFPLWDAAIAHAFGCKYDYLEFMRLIKGLAVALALEVDAVDGHTLLKVIDEYNFAKFTRGWV